MSNEFMKQLLSPSSGRKLRQSFSLPWLGFHYASSTVLKMFAIPGCSHVAGCIAQAEDTHCSPESPQAQLAELYANLSSFSWLIQVDVIHSQQVERGVGWLSEAAENTK